jgi:hypothetical protein
MESFIIYSVYVEYGKPSGSAHFLLIMYTSMETIVYTQVQASSASHAP